MYDCVGKPPYWLHRAGFLILHRAVFLTAICWFGLSLALESTIKFRFKIEIEGVFLRVIRVTYNCTCYLCTCDLEWLYGAFLP